MVITTLLIWFADIYIQSWDSANNSLNNASATFRILEAAPFWAKFLSLLLSALNAFLISQLNNRHSIIRNRSFLPVFFFTLLVASWYNTHIIPLAHFTLTLFLFALFVFYSIFRNRNAAEQVYASTVLVAIASLIYAPLTLYIPVFWIGLGMFHSFSLRTFLASILGALTPWIIYVAINYGYHQNFDWIQPLADSFTVGLQILERPINELIYLVALLALAIFGFAGVLSNISQDSLQTRALIYFNTLVLFFSFVASILFVRMYFVFLPFVGMTYALLLAHAITTGKSDYYKLLFIIFVVLNAAYILSNIILYPL